MKKKGIKIERDEDSEEKKDLKALLEEAKKEEQVEVEEVNLDEEEQDDDDDLFTVSKKDVFNVKNNTKKRNKKDEVEEPREPVPSILLNPSKATTKAARVKKLLKKGGVLNTKIVFNEDGEAEVSISYVELIF